MFGLSQKQRIITQKDGKKYYVTYLGCDQTDRDCVYAIVVPSDGFVKIGHIFNEDLGERVNRYLKSDRDKTVKNHVKNHGNVWVLKLNEYHHNKTSQTEPEDFLFILEQLAIRDYAYELIKEHCPTCGKLIKKNEHILEWVNKKHLSSLFGNKKFDRKQMLVDLQLGLYPDVDEFIKVSPNKIEFLLGFTKEYNKGVG